jgi:IS30 family transposase
VLAKAPTLAGSSLAMKPYKRLTLEERYSIEQMRKAEYKQNKIAELLERSEGTISRELNRITGQGNQKGSFRIFIHKSADLVYPFNSPDLKRFT